MGRDGAKRGAATRAHKRAAPARERERVDRLKQTAREVYAEQGQDPVQSYLLVTRYMAERVAKDNMLGAADIQEMLGVPLLGVVPEGDEVLKSTNIGRPVILMEDSNVGLAYQDLVRRFLGEECELRFLQPAPVGIGSKLGALFS